MWSRHKYLGGRFTSASLGLSHMLLAATVMIVLFYGLKHEDKHSILCTFGQQFISGIAILSTEVWYRDSHRYTHISLHILGLLLAIVGIVVLNKSFKMPEHNHGIAGYIGIVCTVINAVTGPVSYCLGDCWWWTHILIGTVAFIASSTSLGYAIYMPIFKIWAGDTFIVILLICIIIYTLDITLSCLGRLI